MANPLKEIPSSFGLRNLNALLLPTRNYQYFKDWQRFPFDAGAAAHSPANAWWLAECSLLAYETPDRIQSILASVKRFAPASFRSLQNAKTGLDGFSVEGEDIAILCFRGTEFYRPEDIMRDMRKVASMGTDIRQDTNLWLDTFEGTPRFDVPVVGGFYESLQSVWPELMAWIGSLPPSRSLWLTGHSLGGALAAMLAFQFPDRVAGLYTFGCPCPGGQAFAEAFSRLVLNGRAFRFVYGNDLVAKGLEFPGAPYRHVGTLIPLEANSRKNLLERAWNWLLPRDLTDHAPLYYALETWNLIPD